VHAFPSSQEAVLLVCTQPDAGLQESSVHPLLSLQLIATWLTFPLLGLQESVVHASESSTATALPG
jgi:hypothetical protein